MPLVSLIMIDGLRPDALQAAHCPNLIAWQQQSAYTLQATSVLPSFTLPCHMSIFHSVPPSRHGIMSNEWQPLARPLPGLIEAANRAGKRCAFFFSWEQLRDLSRPGHLEESFFVSSGEHNGRINPQADEIVATAAGRALADGRYDFAFVYLGSVDIAGHAYGWMSDGYLAQVARVDGLFGKLRAALPPDSTILLQSDHGGHQRGHGTDLPEDMTIPWMIAGPKIRADYEIETAVSLLDTAPTLAHILQIPAPPQWEGACVPEIWK